MVPQFVRSARGERYLHEVNRDAFAATASAEVFERRLDVDFGAEDTLHVVVGTDSALLPRWLAGRPVGAGSHRLFVELDEYRDAVVEALAGIVDGTDASLAAASRWEEAFNGLDPARWLLGGRVVVVESVGCAAGYAPGYAALARRVRTRLGEIVHAVGARLHVQTFVDVQLRNAADNRRPAAAVGRVGEGRTAIVLGGGPSLDDHLDWILAHREALFVIAASRLSGKLAAAGLAPDVVMAVDPQDALFDISKEGLALADATLVSSYHACAPLVQQWRGPRLYTGRALPWEVDGAPDADNVDSVGATVSHCALWLAYRWGFSEILLSGVDLCYAPGGATHARDSIESLCTALPANYETQVRTYSGRRAGTSMALRLGLEELEAMGETIAGAGVRVYNLAADAARVDSIAHRESRSIRLGAPRPSLGVEPDGADDRPRLRALARELDAAARGLGTIRERCAEAARCLDGLHGTVTGTPDYRSKHALDALDRALEDEHARWMALVKRYAAFELARRVAPRGFEAMSDTELERWGRDYYRIVDAAAARLAGGVERARERVEHRLLEADPAGSIERLVDYWRRDGTLGRVEIALAAPPPGISEPERDALALARREHAAGVASARTAYRERHTAKKHDAANALRTVALLFAERDAEDLASLAAGIGAMGERWAPIALWAEGQRAELDGDAGTALDRYRRIVERSARENELGIDPPPGAERLLEDVLIRIVALQLGAGDGESALAGLAILSRLSPAYLPRRAALLALLGRPAEGAGLLEEFLGSGLGDWRAADQLAGLYRALGAGEAAALAGRLADELRGEAVAPETRRAA